MPVPRDIRSLDQSGTATWDYCRVRLLRRLSRTASLRWQRYESHMRSRCLKAELPRTRWSNSIVRLSLNQPLSENTIWISRRAFSARSSAVFPIALENDEGKIFVTAGSSSQGHSHIQLLMTCRCKGHSPGTGDIYGSIASAIEPNSCFVHGYDVRQLHTVMIVVVRTKVQQEVDELRNQILWCLLALVGLQVGTEVETSHEVVAPATTRTEVTGRIQFTE